MFQLLLLTIIKIFQFCNEQESQHRTTVAVVLHRGKKCKNDSVKLSVYFGFKDRIALSNKEKCCVGPAHPVNLNLKRDPYFVSDYSGSKRASHLG